MSSSEPLRAAPPEAEIGTLGRKLRNRRTVRGMSLQQVAELSGISVGQLSGIERGVYSPTLGTLRRVCDALGMPWTWLFDPVEGEAEEDAVVVRSDARRQLVLEANGITKEMLTPDEATNIQMLRMVIEPGGGWEGAFSTARRRITARSGLVLSGTLELTLDDEVYRLGPGDSFGTDGRERIAFRSAGNESCEVVWVTTPAVY